MIRRLFVGLALAAGLTVAALASSPNIGNGVVGTTVHGGCDWTKITPWSQTAIGNGADPNCAPNVWYAQSWGASGLTLGSATTTNGHSHFPNSGSGQICPGDPNYTGNVYTVFGWNKTRNGASNDTLFPGVSGGVEGSAATTSQTPVPAYTTAPTVSDDFAEYHDQPNCISLGQGYFLIPFFAGEAADPSNTGFPAYLDWGYNPNGAGIAQLATLSGPAVNAANGSTSIAGITTGEPIVAIPTSGLSEQNAATIGTMTMICGNAQADSFDRPNTSGVCMDAHLDTPNHNLWWETEADQAGSGCTYSPDCYEIHAYNTTSTPAPIANGAPADLVVATPPQANQWNYSSVSAMAVGGTIKVGIGSANCTYTSSSATIATAIAGWASYVNTNSACSSVRSSAGAGPGTHKAVACANTVSYPANCIGIEDNGVAFPIEDATAVTFTCSAGATCAAATLDNEGNNSRLVEPMIREQNGCFLLALTADNNTTNWLTATQSSTSWSLALFGAKMCPSASVTRSGTFSGSTNPAASGKAPVTVTWSDLSGNGTSSAAHTCAITFVHSFGNRNNWSSCIMGSNQSLTTSALPFLIPNATGHQDAGTVPFAADWTDESDTTFAGTPIPIFGGSQSMAILPTGDVIFVYSCQDTSGHFRECYLTFTPGTSSANHQGFVDNGSGADGTYMIGGAVQVNRAGEIDVMISTGNGTQARFGCTNPACLVVFKAPYPAKGSTAALTWTQKANASWAAGANGSPGTVSASPDGEHLFGTTYTGNGSALEGEWNFGTFDCKVDSPNCR